MVGDAGAAGVWPVANPDLREGKRQRLIRMTNAQVEGRGGPVRQIRYRDEVVSPIALELNSRELLRRAQRAIATIVTSQVYAGDLRAAAAEPVLRWHEWQIAIALRDITELLLDLVSLERLAAQVAAADAARRDWETAHRMAANNDKYRDLVARTAADQHATMEITGLAEQAAEAAQALRETLQQATLAAEALALPEPH